MDDKGCRKTPSFRIKQHPLEDAGLLVFSFSCHSSCYAISFVSIRYSFYLSSLLLWLVSIIVIMIIFTSIVYYYQLLLFYLL